MSLRISTLVCFLLLFGSATMLLGQTFVVSSSLPVQGDIATPVDSVIITFNQNPDVATLVNIKVFGEYYGKYGIITQTNGNSVFLRPTLPFIAGEKITVMLPGTILSQGGDALTPYRLGFQVPASQGDIEQFSLLIHRQEIDLPLGDEQPVSIVAANFNNGFFSDVAVINSTSNTLTILQNTLGLPGSSFNIVSTLPTAGKPLDLVAGDFDDDGDPDLAAACFNGAQINFFWNEGNYNFTTTTLPTNGLPAALAVDDFNGDGNLDLAAAIYNQGQVVVYQNTGGRSFTAQAPLAAAEGAFDLASGDLDGNGTPDIAAINNGAKTVSFFLNTGFSAWSALPAQSFTQPPVRLEIHNSRTANSANTLEVAVLTADQTILGKQTAASVESHIYVFEFNSGNFNLIDDVVLTGISAQAFAVASLDRTRNADDDLDLLVADYAGGKMIYYEQRPVMGVDKWAFNRDLEAGTEFPRDILTADFDRDGDNDVLYSRHSENDLILYLTPPPPPLEICSFLFTSYDFMQVCVGDTGRHQQTITNTGSVDLTVDFALADTMNFAIRPPSVVLPPGGSETIEFLFFPTNVSAYQATAVVTTDFPSHPVCNVFLEGEGAIPDIRVDSLALNFGRMPFCLPNMRDLRIFNDGDCPLEISEFVSAGTAFTHPTGPVTVQSGSFFDLTIDFNQSSAGVFQDILTIRSNDPDMPEIDVLLRGEKTANLPIIASNSAWQIPENQFVCYTASATDPDGIGANITFANFPPWLNPSGNQICGQSPAGPDTASFWVIASNSCLTDSLRVSVIIDSVNDAPFFDPVPSQLVFENELLEFLVIAHDPEGQPIVFSDNCSALPGPPSCDQVNDSAIRFSWRPGFDDAGIYTATFTATEANGATPLSATLSVQITVREVLPDLLVENLQIDPPQARVNQPFSISAQIRNRSAPVDQSFTIQITRDGEMLARINRNGMAVDDTAQVATTTTVSEPGTVRLVVIADANDEVNEENENNNSLTLTIEVLPGELFVRPNPFTPNGDSKNDEAVFDVSELAVSSPSLNIFDINGRKIRGITNLQNNALRWDGRDESSTEQLPGVYLYVLQDGSEIIGKGYIVLAR